MSIRTVAVILAAVSAVMGGLHFLKGRMPSGLALWMPKLLAGALAPYMAVAGAAGAAIGLFSRSRLAVVAGLAGTWASTRYVLRVMGARGGFEQAFGPNWPERLPQQQVARMLQGRWTWVARSAPEARWERDVPFWTIPGTDRQLLCDVWQPAAGIEPSGLAIVYLHGSGWYLTDKDFGTRSFFRHLAGQGHVVVDVAYRLCPEVDIRGMAGDAKRAVVWTKANAARYGIDPARVVLGGASAGGHVALLAAYTPDHPDLRPADVGDADLSVQAVFAYYPPTDMHAIHDLNPALQEASRAARTEYVPPPPRERRRAWLSYQADQLGRSSNSLVDLLGGLPDEVPEMYDLASPVFHAGAGCPPTLLVHGEHDLLVPVEPTRALHRKLLDAGVPVVYLELPQTEHAFDLLLARTSPPAQAALYELERFLALMAGGGPRAMQGWGGGPPRSES